MKAIPREMLLMIVRHGLTSIGTYLVATGTLTESDGTAFAAATTEIIGAIMTLLGLAWSARRKIERARAAQPVQTITPRTGGHPAK